MTTGRVSAYVLPAFLLLTSCKQPPRVVRAPSPNPCAARLAELQKENERLRGELAAAQESTSTLDATLRSIEADLGELAGVDTNIRNLQRTIETGINVKSSREQIRGLVKRLKDAMGERRKLLAKAQTDLATLKARVGAEGAGKQEEYGKVISRLEQQVARSEAETGRLVKERDSYERLYKAASQEALAEHSARTAAEESLTEEQRQREAAERLQYRVHILAATKSELRKKGVLTGRWYQRKSSECLCEECRSEEDRRTLTEVQIPAPANRVTVYSSHPKKSFRVAEKDATTAVLVIGDADAFWSGSHCLVIGY